MIYCATCGGREVHGEEWRNVNTGEYVCSSDGDFYCGGLCDAECSVTEDRREAAQARLATRLRSEAGCTCEADLTVPDALGRATGATCALAAHAEHCEAA